ncbi:pentatricopeptide repeat-containing protein At1g74630-like [Wolffia australiana]
MQPWLSSLLGACRSRTHLDQLQAHLLKTRLEASPLLSEYLLHLPASGLPFFLPFLSFLPSSYPFLHNSLIRSLSPSSSSLCLLPFIAMRRSFLPPDSFTFVFSLKAASSTAEPSHGEQLHAQALLHGLSSHLFVSTTLITLYSELGRLRSALKVFDEMPVRNVVSWNAVVSAYAKAGDVAGAWRVFCFAPVRDSTSWNIVLAGLVRSCGDLARAVMVFRLIPEHARDSVSWSTMVSGLSMHGDYHQAFVFFRESLRAGALPNEVALSSVLSACANSGALALACSLHGFLDKAGLNGLLPACNSLLSAYAKCGDVPAAEKFFWLCMEQKSVVSWTAMAGGLAAVGRADEAVQLFLEMELQGFTPDAAAFISLLQACSHGRLVELGQNFFSIMQTKYQLTPSVEHYGCMVDIYARAGRLDKAFEMAMMAPTKEKEVLWRTILGACVVHGEVNMAEEVERKLVEMGHGEAGDCVLLSNVYARAGRWREAARVRERMRNQRMDKPPGWSSVEVGAKASTLSGQAVELQHTPSRQGDNLLAFAAAE